MLSKKAMDVTMSEDTESPYRMRIDLSVLDHLGINLYSNIPSVLSEAVANAWDADAENVRIEMIDGDIVIQDDGTGMSLDDINNRFLLVGYERRKEQKGNTPKGRQPMGRKGIGKLSLFSIAETVEVHTCKGGNQNAFCMTTEGIRESRKNPGEDYKPEQIDFDERCSVSESGTRIILRNLKISYNESGRRFLRRRLARRFSVIGAKHKFHVSLNGEQISTSDRGYYESVQYIWTYGEQADVLESCKNLEHSEDRSNNIGRGNLSIQGWLATVMHPKNLKEEIEKRKSENLNRIAIYVRGKMAQEDMLSDFSKTSVYMDYLIGEIRVDALDADDQPDAATSSRQKLMENDPRYQDLKETIHRELTYIRDRWKELRGDSGIKHTKKKFPAVAVWLDTLQPVETRKKAERWIGRLNQIRSDDDDKTYKALLEHAILGFEKFRHRDKLEKLENIRDEDLDAILKIFEGVDDLENSYYGQIVSTRLEVIKTFQNLVNEDKIEKIIQRYIFDHLWLLDPSWERVKGSGHMEQSIGRILKQDADLNEEEKRSRIDIEYRTIAGKHVIVELKRSSARLSIDDLTAQIRKYRNAFKKEIRLDQSYNDWPLEIVCILGSVPGSQDAGVESNKKDLQNALAAVDARPVYYKELIGNAQRAYADYLEKHREHDKLWQIFERAEDFSDY